jgi:predicted ABC-type ATPase
VKELLARRPILIALAGPNGAGKSTFYKNFIEDVNLPFVNADVLSAQLQIDPYSAASLADKVRRELLSRSQSFVFETVFSDPVGDKIEFLKHAESAGYTVVLFFIGIPGPSTSEERVAIRVAKGGHDVPSEKLVERYPRILENLKRALTELSNVRVYDNSDLRNPFRLVASRENSGPIRLLKPVPQWLAAVLP